MPKRTPTPFRHALVTATNILALSSGHLQASARNLASTGGLDAYYEILASSPPSSPTAAVALRVINWMCCVRVIARRAAAREYREHAVLDAVTAGDGALALGLETLWRLVRGGSVRFAWDVGEFFVRGGELERWLVKGKGEEKGRNVVEQAAGRLFLTLWERSCGVKSMHDGFGGGHDWFCIFGDVLLSVLKEAEKRDENAEEDARGEDEETVEVLCAALIVGWCDEGIFEAKKSADGEVEGEEVNSRVVSTKKIVGDFLQDRFDRQIYGGAEMEFLAREVLRDVYCVHKVAEFKAQVLRWVRENDKGVDWGMAVDFKSHLAVCCACGTVAEQGVFLSSKLRSCGACRIVTYCGEECQKRHWAIHAPNCARSERSRIDDDPDKDLEHDVESDVLFASVEGEECTHAESRSMSGIAMLLLLIATASFLIVRFLGAKTLFGVVSVFLGFKIYWA